MLNIRCMLGLLLSLLLLASLAEAGGVAPGEEAPEQPEILEKVTATPAQTSAAVSKARQAVAPQQPAAAKSSQPARSVTPPRSKGTTRVDKDSWMLGEREGVCSPLSSASAKAGNIGSFSTPQEFARKMQQRGHQAFVLDIGDVRDQVVRVRIPDLELDLTFVRAGACR